MDFKGLLFIALGVWAAIMAASCMFAAAKWSFKKIFMLGFLGRILKITAVAGLLLICSLVYTFIFYMTTENGLLSLVQNSWVELINKEPFNGTPNGETCASRF